jgi:hypothetical protein
VDTGAAGGVRDGCHGGVVVMIKVVLVLLLWFLVLAVIFGRLVGWW